MDYYNYGLPQYGQVWNNQPYQQPYQIQLPQYQQNCQCDNRFMWIQGKEAAKSYPMAPDKTIFFLDDKESYAYLKKTDKDGKTIQFKTFQLVEEQEPELITAQPTGNVVSKDEFDNFSRNVDSSLNELKEMILAMNKPYNKPYNQKGQVNKNG